MIVVTVAVLSLIVGAACDGTDAGSSTSAPVTPPGSPEPATEPLPDSIEVTGRYAFATAFDASPDPDLQVTFEVPAGYEGFGGVAALHPHADQTGVNIIAVGDVYAESCSWVGTELDPSSISSAKGLAAALVKQVGLRMSERTEVEVDGFPATYLVRTVPARTRLTDCDDEQFRVYTDRFGGARWLDPGQVDHLWVVDIDGVPLVIDASYEAGTAKDIQAEVLEMAGSVQIDQQG